MTWVLKKVEDPSPSLLFDLAKQHGLVPDSVQSVLRCYHSMSTSSAVLYVMDGDQKVATVVVSAVVPGETAELDLIPVSQYFRSGYSHQLRDVMTPLWRVLFGEMALRRVTSWVPESRTRTLRALRALGFEDEGTMRMGLKLRDKDPEDLVMLGLLGVHCDAEVQ